MPEGLQKLYILSKAFSGEFPEAVAEMQLLTEHNPSGQNLTLLRDLYLQKGDRVGLRHVANLVQQKKDIQPGDIITFANSVFWASRDLAAEMWRGTPTEQLSSQKMIEKMMLGFALGFDHEMSDLSKHVNKMAESGETFIRLNSEEEMLHFLQDEHRQKNELFRQYTNGEIPVHALIANTGFNLFALYKNILRENSQPLMDIKRKFPLYVRYGGWSTLRGLEEPPSAPQFEHFTLDTTSILLLDHFSVLPNLESEVESLYLPSNTVLALIQMKDSLLRYQPEVARASKLIGDLLGEKKIKEIQGELRNYGEPVSDSDTLLNFIRSIEQAKGYVVGHHKYLDLWNSSGLEATTLHFITCADVINNLRATGVITEEQHRNGIEQLGVSAQHHTDAKIPGQANLFFMNNTIQQVAHTEVFEQLCRNYSVWIESEEVLRIRSTIKDERERQNYANKLQELIDRINTGIDRGKYLFVPILPDNETKDVLLFTNLIECVSSYQEIDSTPIIDDHVIQKHLYTDGKRCYGTFETLSWLHRRGAIDDVRYFERLNDLRRADLRFIPVEKDEILFHLKKAGTEDGQLIESSALKTLRSYIAACFTFGKKLEVPHQPSSSSQLPSEVEFLFSLIHAVSYSVAEIWMESVSEHEKIAKCVWILDNLYLDLLSLCEVVGWERDINDHLFLVGLGLAEFFLNGLQFNPSRKNNNERKDYFEWIYRAVCEPVFNANPGLFEKTVEFIKTSVTNTLNGPKEPDVENIILSLLGKFYNDLPASFKTYLNEDPAFLQQVGIEIVTVTEIAGILFPAKAFWDGVSETIAGKPTLIQAVSPDIGIQLMQKDFQGKIGITFIHPERGQNINIEVADLAFVINASYESWVEDNVSSYIELSLQQLQEFTEEVRRMSTASERLDTLGNFRKSSIGFAYRMFENDLFDKQVFNFDHLLPPNAFSLLQLLGLDSLSQKSPWKANKLTKAAKYLTNQQGLDSAISRLCSLPVELPNFLLTQVKDLPHDERKKLFSNLSDGLTTPLARIHLIRLLGQYPDYQPQILTLLKTFFTQDAEIEFTAFAMLLSWVMNALDNLVDIQPMDDSVKLIIAWGHSDHLFRIIQKHSVPLNWLISTLKTKRSSQLNATQLIRKPALWKDVVYGENLDFLTFKVFGLAYALQAKNLPNELGEQLVGNLFPNNGKSVWPSFTIMRDRNVFENRLASFLGAEISEALYGLLATIDENVPLVSASSLRELALQAIDWITQADKAILGWQLLIVIYHNQIIPDELREPFANNIQEYCFNDLLADDASIAFLALNFTARQVLFLDQANYSHLKNEIFKLAEVGPTLYPEPDFNNGQKGKVEAISLVSEAALQVALAEIGGTFGMEFSSLIQGIVTRWDDTREINLRLLNNLIRSLPISIAKDLAGILLEIRANT